MKEERENIYIKEVNKNIFYKVDKYRGKIYIHIRKFDYLKDEKRVVPTKIGVWFTELSEIYNLKEAIDESLKLIED